MNNDKLFKIIESQSAILSFNVADWLFKFGYIVKKIVAKTSRRIAVGRLLVTSPINN